ncbi:SWPV1-282 [Shearwaterpox virus]|uniref:SWPV1-282 n=1 Tax=Shearwaterpox virus TaxID=1974596 RepID=A0A1V0S884_CNPV|nr:SWPV1-282 [Shearwaterpox virus]
MGGKLCMYDAIMTQNEYVIHTLMNNGKDPNIIITPEGLKPLHKAVEYRNVNITSILLHRGADANSKDIFDFGTLHILSMFTGIRHLFDTGYKIEDIYSIRNYNYAPLEKDHDTKTLKIADMLLTSKANINMSTKYGSTPLHIAVKYKNHSMVKFLLEKGADINVLDCKNNTPIFYACYYGNLYMSKLLISYGAKINLINKYGHSPLYYAVFSGNAELVKLLLSRNSYPNIIDITHTSVVHKAVDNRDIVILKILLNSGANCNIKDVNGYTALHYACKINDKVITSILLEHGADPNSKNRSYRTPIYEAIICRCYDNIELLLHNGADINVIDVEGNTPLSFLPTIDDRCSILIISHIILNNFHSNNINNSAGARINNFIIENNEIYSYIKNECINEILHLKNIKFHSGYTAEIFLQKNISINLLSKFVKHPKLTKLEDDMHFYSYVFKKSILLAKNRYKLIENSLSVINSINEFLVLPDTIKYCILEMLDDKELAIISTN